MHTYGIMRIGPLENQGSNIGVTHERLPDGVNAVVHVAFIKVVAKAMPNADFTVPFGVTRHSEIVLFIQICQSLWAKELPITSESLLNSATGGIHQAEPSNHLAGRE
jgi:hypothetical protein